MTCHNSARGQLWPQVWGKLAIVRKNQQLVLGPRTFLQAMTLSSTSKVPLGRGGKVESESSDSFCTISRWALSISMLDIESGNSVIRNIVVDPRTLFKDEGNHSPYEDKGWLTSSLDSLASPDLLMGIALFP